MKHKIKKIIKNRIFIFMLGIFIAGTAGVTAATYFPSNDVTYDNTNSGLKSNDVQSAIDELYVKCSKPDTPIANNNPIEIVTSGDGLYKDEYEEGKYIYRGTSPKNYIRFNDENWRILSFESDETIKLIDTDINTKANGRTIWGDYGTNWAESSLVKSVLPNNYNNLLARDKEKVISHAWNAGKLISNDSTSYLGQLIKDEKSVQWNGYMGLITVSEYLKANSDYINCGTIELDKDNYKICKTKNWLYTPLTDLYGGGSWTMTEPNDSSGRTAYIVTENATGTLSTPLKSYTPYYVMPVVYISSHVNLVGNGTINNPYRIEGNI